MSDTPRTTEIFQECGSAPRSFVERLERELNTARAELAKAQERIAELEAGQPTYKRGNFIDKKGGGEVSEKCQFCGGGCVSVDLINGCCGNDCAVAFALIPDHAIGKIQAALAFDTPEHRALIGRGLVVESEYRPEPVPSPIMVPARKECSTCHYYRRRFYLEPCYSCKANLGYSNWIVAANSKY